MAKINAWIKTGPPGNGKSSAVYGIAEELGLHVLEVNASSCRTGKQVKSSLFYTWFIVPNSMSP